MNLSVELILERLSDGQGRGRLVNGDALGSKLSQIAIKRICELHTSVQGDVAFFFSKEYQARLLSARPSVLITAEPFVEPILNARLTGLANAAIIACRDPYFAMAKLSEWLVDEMSSQGHHTHSSAFEKQIHPTAVISPLAKVGSSVVVGPYCVIDDNAEIGNGTVLYPHCFVGKDSKIGEHGVLFAGVKIYENVKIGKRVRLHSGAVIGSDGFGYAPQVGSDGKPVDHQKMYHVGGVLMGDDVEIGANSCVDRATFGNTLIGNKVKLDNQVHIGHNAELDEGAIICGGTCLAGSARVGKFAYIGGLTGIANKVFVGDYAKVGAVSLVTKDVPSGGTALGNPQRDYHEHFRSHAKLSKLLKDRKPKS